MGKLKWLFTEGVTDLTSYRLGQMQERERIIKLLDSQRDNGSHDAENDFVNGLLDDLIALIEGEK